MKNSSVAIIFVLLAGAAAVVAVIAFQYTRPPTSIPTPKKTDDASLVYLENGLTTDDRATFYHMTEGSEIYPVLWLQALETKNGKMFLDDVERLGFLKDEKNPDGLPIGLTKGETRGLEALGPMTGLNCAACHVGELHYGGKRVRIDGAPNLLNTREFFITLIDSALDTAKDPAKLIAFVVRVKNLEDQQDKVEPSPIKILARKLALAVAKKDDEVFHAALQPVIKKIIDQEKSLPHFDFKAAIKEDLKDADAFRKKVAKDLKLDDLAELLNKSTVLKAAVDEVHRHGALTDFLNEVYIKLRLLRARAVFLQKLGLVGDDEKTNWGAGRVDAFGSARAFLFQAGYPPVNPVSYPPIFGLKSHDWFHYDNNTNTFLERNFGQALGVGAVWDEQSKNYSLRPRNLRTLENLARKLSAPQWPEDVFGKIDPERAKRGEVLYMKFCAACHNAPKEGEAFVKLDALDDIKTDKARALMFAETLPDGTPFFDAIKNTMAAIKVEALKEFSPEEQAEIKKEPVTWQGPGKYSSRAIKGAWATAPYLHNGSVPTLDDLLQPADKRPKTFYVGSHQFDVEKLGYKSDEKMTLFDTSKPGNSNVGHDGEAYGTNISAEERKDLLEYLKSQ